jgi:hypothetical protein
VILENIYPFKQVEVNCGTYLANYHYDAAHHEEHLAAVPVDDEGGEKEEDEVHRAEYDGAHQRGVVAEPDGAEKQRREEGEHDDAGELEEHGHGDSEHQVRAVGPPRGHPAERAVLALARDLHGPHDVLELGVHVRAGAAHAEESGAGALHPPAHDEAAGGVREEERADEDEDGRHACETQRHAPAPGVARREIVGDASDEHAEGEEELEAGGEGTAPLRRGHLGEEQGSRLQ